MIKTKDDGVMRSFNTGATRDTSEGKLDFDGFLHPDFLEQFAKYMNMHRLQSDGNLRNSDNWQKGIPTEICRKSLWRHFFEAWTIMRRHTDLDTGMMRAMGRENFIDMMAGLMGQVFNIQCIVANMLKDYDMVDFDGDEPTDEIRKRRAKLFDEAHEMEEDSEISDEHFAEAVRFGQLMGQSTYPTAIPITDNDCDCALCRAEDGDKEAVKSLSLGASMIPATSEELCGDDDVIPSCTTCRHIEVHPVDHPCDCCQEEDGLPNFYPRD